MILSAHRQESCLKDRKVEDFMILWATKRPLLRRMAGTVAPEPEQSFGGLP